MGKFEKLVVLTVLFLAAIVFAVTLGGGGDSKQEPQTPQVGQREQLQSQLEQPDPLQTESGLLASISKSNAANGKLPPAPLVRDTSGLQPSTSPDFMIHTVAAGDDWRGLALRYYGDESLAQVLRRANEGTEQLRVGLPVLVPVTWSVVEQVRAALQAAPQPEAPLNAAPGGQPLLQTPETQTPVPALDTPAVAAPRQHTVKAGESLSTISKLYYGTANRWKEIFEANQATIKDPNRLRLGQVLLIP